MRAFDRDLIRGGHYGQRSCEPHPKAEHMAAPTNAANVKKVLVNSEPSTHGTSLHFAAAQQFGHIWSEADINQKRRVAPSAFGRTFARLGPRVADAVIRAGGDYPTGPAPTASE